MDTPEQEFEAWENAQGYAGLIGDIPSSFTTVIRALKADADRGEKELSQSARYLLLRLLKGPSLLSPLYFLTKRLYPERLGSGPLNASTLVSFYKPLDLAAFLAVVYLNRRVKTKVDASEWDYLTPSLEERLDIGGLLGVTIPALAPGVGLLGSSFRYLATSTFLIHDKKGFVDYRRRIKNDNFKLLSDWELSRWGCTGLHVAAILMQAFGFGVSLANSFVVGLTPFDYSAGDPDEDEEIYRFRILSIWVESMNESGKVPGISHRGEYYPEGDKMTALREGVKNKSKFTSTASWANKGKDDLSIGSAPELFADPKTAEMLSRDSSSATGDDDDSEPV